jgi:hypothetical protein
MNWLGGRHVLGGAENPLCVMLANSINTTYSIRKNPGKVKNDVKTMPNGAYLLQACGILDLEVYDGSANSVNTTLDQVVDAFKKIVSDKLFHQFYSLAAAKCFIKDFQNNPQEFKKYIDFCQQSGQGLKKFDFSRNGLALGIHQDKNGFLKKFNSSQVEVRKNVPLDMLLDDDKIKKVGQRLFGHYSDTYASVIWQAPKNRSFSSL